MTIKEYTIKFEQLLVLCDIKNLEEQTIAWYLCGLKLDIEQVV